MFSKWSGFMVACVMALLLCACSKNEELSDVPELEFIAALPSDFVQYSDTLTLTFSYKDGNGDLGKNAPEVYNCFVTDSRNGVEYKFRIQQLAPDADIAIQGTLHIPLTGIPVLNGQTSETYTYSIRVVDRAGNESNSISSTAVTVHQ